MFLYHSRKFYARGLSFVPLSYPLVGSQSIVFLYILCHLAYLTLGWHLMLHLRFVFLECTKTICFHTFWANYLPLVTP
jgi:hypothetical protein